MNRSRFAELALGKMQMIVAALVAKGQPDMTPWWRDLYSRFLSAPCLRLVLRVGRRGGKSTWAVVYAVAHALVYAALGLVPPATIGWVVFVSVNRDEAGERLHTAKFILDALGVRYEAAGDSFVIAGTNIGFRVQSCTMTGAVGHTAILVVADEVARWRDKDGFANPAREVLGSLMPMLAGQPFGLSLWLSSPLGLLDAHAEAFALGDGDHQMTAFAPTWIARPSLSEEDTRKLEPNERVWRREYAAIPQGELTAVFSLDDIDACMQPLPEQTRIASSGSRVMVIDASRGRDDWTYAILSWASEERERTPAELGRSPAGNEWCMAVPAQTRTIFDALTSERTVTWYRQDMGGQWWPTEPSAADLFIRRPVLHVEDIGEVPNARNSRDACAYLEKIACEHRAWAHEGRVRRLLQDQYEGGALPELLREHGFQPAEPLNISARSKPIAVDRLERVIRERQARFPRNEKLRKQLARYSEKVTRSGSLTYAGAASGSAVDDYVGVLVTAALGDTMGLLPGSPHTPVNVRHEIGPVGPDPNDRGRR